MADASRAAVEAMLLGEEFDRLEALVTLGATAVPALMEIAQAHDDTLMRARALIALGRIGDARAVPVAQAALTSTHPQERLSAVHALAGTGGEAATPDLLALLGDANPSVVETAVQGLAAVGGAGAVAALQHLAAHAPADFLKPLVAAAVAEINTRVA